MALIQEIALASNYTLVKKGLAHEYILDLESLEWSTGYTIPNSNGNAGAACWPGETPYLYKQNALNELQMILERLPPRCKLQQTPSPQCVESRSTPSMPSRIPDDPIWTTQLPGPSPGPIVSGLDIRPDTSIATSYLVYIQDPQS